MYALADYMYDRQVEITAKFPDERWVTVAKLRNTANDAMFYISLAIGSSHLYAAAFEWNSARKYIFAMQTEYMFAGKQKLLDTEPEIMKRIDNLLQEVDTQLAASEEASKEKDRKDLEPWLEKHRLWKEINNN